MEFNHFHVFLLSSLCSPSSVSSTSKASHVSLSIPISSVSVYPAPARNFKRTRKREKRTRKGRSRSRSRMPLPSLHPSLPQNPTVIGSGPSSSASPSASFGRAVGSSSLAMAGASPAGGGGSVNRETLKGLQDVEWSDDEVSRQHPSTRRAARPSPGLVYDEDSRRVELPRRTRCHAVC